MGPCNRKNVVRRSAFSNKTIEFQLRTLLKMKGYDFESIYSKVFEIGTFFIQKEGLLQVTLHNNWV